MAGGFFLPQFTKAVNKSGLEARPPGWEANHFLSRSVPLSYWPLTARKHLRSLLAG